MQLFAHSSLLIAAPPPPNGCKLLAFRIERSTLFLFSVCSYLSLYLSLLTTVFARSCFLSSIDRIFFVCLFFHNNIISNNRNNYFRIPSVCVLYVCRRVCLSWFLDFCCLLKFCEHRAPWSIWWGWCKSTRLNINEFITANGHLFLLCLLRRILFGRLNYISTNCSRYMLPRVCKSIFSTRTLGKSV